MKSASFVKLYTRPWIEAVTRQLWTNMRRRGALPWDYDDAMRRNRRLRAPYRREAATIIRSLAVVVTGPSLVAAAAEGLAAVRLRLIELQKDPHIIKGLLDPKLAGFLRAVFGGLVIARSEGTEDE